jgi:hypothetical protein
VQLKFFVHFSVNHYFLAENALENDAAREDFREQHPFT